MDNDIQVFSVRYFVENYEEIPVHGLAFLSVTVLFAWHMFLTQVLSSSVERKKKKNPIHGKKNR
jgi:hypothetical protein